jgi:hypothetical protein
MVRWKNFCSVNKYYSGKQQNDPRYNSYERKLSAAKRPDSLCK